MSAGDEKPVVGQTDECAVCGRPVRYAGPFWEHVGDAPRHKPVPKAAGGADPLGGAG